MKLAAISALVMIVLSLVLWLTNWVMVTFFLYGFGGPLRYVAQTANLLSAMAQYVALGLIAIGLLLASKTLVKSGGQM